MNDANTYDIVIVGGGGSGLAAAVSAAENGASVLLLEKLPQVGGTTGIAVGSFTANRTTLQNKAGIIDKLEDHIVDAGKFAPSDVEAKNNHSLRDYFLGHSADTLDWLLAMGLTFHGPSPEPNNRVARMHNVVPNAKAYIATLQAEFIRHGGTIMCNTSVTRLIRENHRVVGVVADYMGEQIEYFARRGVVLAAGDYANSSEIIGAHKGIEYAHIEGINPYATGDGHRLAESVGAKLVNMDVTYGPEIRFVAPVEKGFVELFPSSGPLSRVIGKLLPLVPKRVINAYIKRLLVTWQHPEDALFHDGAILLNAGGQRFCNEKAWPDREIAIARQPDKICYILLDARLASRYQSWPYFVSTAPEIAYAYVDDYLRLRPDVTTAGSLESVTHKRNIPVDQVRATLHAYNQYAEGQVGDPWGRSGDDAPLSGEEWVLLGPAKAYFTTTSGSPAINKQFQILDDNGQPIEGLFAVGQNGLGGQVLWGHGLNIAWAITSGRMLGKALATATAAATST